MLLALHGVRPTDAAGQSRAVELQRRAHARIDGYLDHYRKTGDRSARLGDLGQAVQELEQAHHEFLAASDEAGAAASLVKAGDARRIQNQWNDSLRAYADGERLAHRAQAPVVLAEALLGQARARLYGLKDYTGAASAADEAVRVSGALPDKTILFKALDLKSQVELAKGDPVVAFGSLNRALALQSKVTDAGLLFYAYLGRGDIYLRTAETCDFKPTFDLCDAAVKMARSDYQAALSLAKKLGWTHLAGETDGFVRNADKRRELIAVRRSMQAQLSGTKLFNPRTPADVLVSEQFVAGPQAVPSEVLALSRELGVSAMGDARSAYVQGLLYDMNGNVDAALIAYLRGVDLLENDRRRLRDGEARGTFLEDKADFYHPPILHLLQRRKLEDAFRLMEASRSRVLADLMQTRTVALADPQERGLQARVQELRARIGRLQKELYDLRSKPDSEPAAIASRERMLDELEEQHTAALREVRQRAPRLLELVASEPVPLAAVRQAAAAGGYDVLEYLVLEHGVILWHVGSGGVHVRNVFLPRSELGLKVDLLRKSLVDPQLSFDARISRELFLFLVQPALQWTTSRHLVVIAHEDLHYVPFEVFQNPADSRYLGESFQISYAPSATIWARLRGGPNLSGSAVLALAGPGVAAAPDEVQAIARLYGASQARLLEEASATKSDLKRFVAGHHVLHVAAHGRFDAPEPLLSHIQLRPDGGDDGRLTAAEMFGLPLDTVRLVTLSACELGRATATHAGEIVGMQHALLYAGAGALVLSRWKVDSASTSLWMETFYREAARAPLPEAARRAAGAVKARPEYVHPYYWGAFFLVGR